MTNQSPVVIENGSSRPLGGRPTMYTLFLAKEICQQLMEGRSLSAICRSDSMPSRASVFTWLQDDPEFLAMYNAARDVQVETLADETIDIADDGTNDYVDHELRNGAVVRQVDAEHINRSRLRVETRKWYASVVKPRKYGSATNIKLSTPDGPLQSVALVTNDPIAAAAAYQAMIRGEPDEK